MRFARAGNLSARCQAGVMRQDSVPHADVGLILQGVNESLQPELQQAIAHAVAKFGHVMHPENANEPVVACSEALLGSVGKGWAERVFYTADGCALHP